MSSCCGVTQGENSEIQNAVLLKRTEDVTGLETFEKVLFLGHLQLGVDRNSEDLAISTLEFDDVI